VFLFLLVETCGQLHKHHTINDDFKELEVGRIKRQAALLTENDARYAGRRVSRKDIEEQTSATGLLFLMLYLTCLPDNHRQTNSVSHFRD